MELFNIKEFAMAAPGANDEVFVTWFSKIKNAFFMIPANYLDHTGISSLDSTVKLPKRTNINDYPMEIIFQVICQRSDIAHLQ